MYQRVHRRWPVFLADSDGPRLYLGLWTVTASPGGPSKSLCLRILAFSPRYASNMESIYNICQDVFMKCLTAGKPGNSQPGASADPLAGEEF